MDVESWHFEEPSADRLDYEGYVDSSAWGGLLAEFAATDPARLRPARSLHCAAREFARFYLAYGALPSVALQRAILDHCGTLSDDVMPRFLHGAVGPELSDARLFYDWQAQARPLLYQMPKPGVLDLGLAFARDDERAILVVLSGTRKVQLDEGSRVVGADGALLLRGRSLLPADRISALINRGRYAHAECDPDPGVRAPAFAFRCALDPTDRSARIDVSTHLDGRVMGDTVLGVEARRDSAARDYERLDYAGSETVADADELRSRLLELVNEVRGAAGMGPLVLSAEQSAVSRELAPAYFEASADSAKGLVLDAIVLGLMAGWDVGASICDAGFTAAAVGPTHDAGEWLSAVLAAPSGRAALLDPSSSIAAIGAITVESPPVLGALFSSYSLFDDADHERIERELVERIAGARRERGLSAPVIVTTLDGDADALAAEVRSGAMRPSDALSHLLQTSVRVLGRSVNGYYVEGTNLDSFELPDQLLGANRLELSITVTHYQPAGEPWGRYVVLIAIPGEGTRA